MKIVCFGDSLTSCGGEGGPRLGGRFSDILEDRFPGHIFVNRGVGGESFVEAREHPVDSFESFHEVTKCSRTPLPRRRR